MFDSSFSGLSSTLKGLAGAALGSKSGSKPGSSSSPSSGDLCQMNGAFLYFQNQKEKLLATGQSPFSVLYHLCPSGLSSTLKGLAGAALGSKSGSKPGSSSSSSCNSLPFFYFLTFEKADCSIFALLVGRSVGWLTSPLIFSIYTGIQAFY